MSVRIVTIEACHSTQDEVRARLAHERAGSVIAVRSRSQTAGRGRGEGRGWDDAPGASLLLSIGARGALSVDVLADLPQRVTLATRVALVALCGRSASVIVWKPPNDLMVGDAKLGGVLIDVRTTANTVDEVVIGIGVNISSPAFVTTDGRGATSVSAIGGRVVDVDVLAHVLAEQVAGWLTPEV